MSRAEQANTFCSALLGGPQGDDRLEGLYVTLWTSGDKRTRWRRADEPGAVASLVTELDENDGSQAVYMATTLSSEIRDCAPIHAAEGKPLRHGEGNCRYRPHAKDSAGLIGLWVEIDIAGPGHESEHLPPTREHAEKIIAAMGLAPTLVVSSGGGLHVWWMLAEPWLVRDADDPDAERALMARLEQDWVHAAKHHAEVLGRWQVDSVFDLARLLRPAGTTNRKIGGEPRKVEILHHDPAATYNPDDFSDFLPDDDILKAYRSPAYGVDGIRLTLSEDEQKMLTEVNLNAIWARVNSAEYKAVDYTPPWLADLLEIEVENLGEESARLLKTWTGNRPDLKEDQNRFDASLVRLLADLEIVDTEGIIEAVMCRRLRLADGEKADKVDPRKRIDYITRTVARFRLESQRRAQLTADTEDRIAMMAASAIDTDNPEPDVPDIDLDDDDLIADVEQAQDAFAEYVQEIAGQEEPSESERHRRADEKVRAEHTGEEVPPRPETEGDPDEDGEEEPQYFLENRPAMEQELMGMLDQLLLPEVYRTRGVTVWGLETRDYGETQRGRMILKLPHDFDWPISSARPARYRPGRPLFTDWWRRDAFERPDGFKRALERDAKIVSRADGPKADWAELIRSLVPVWRRDSTGADIATYAHEWLFDYLMLHHGTGQPAEVGASGRPWVKKTNGWRPSKPPVIYIDMKEFLEHCRRQPGAMVGRGSKDVTDFLRLSRRRPRSTAPGMGARPTWYEIDPDQFDAGEWLSIINVTQHSYEISEGKRGLRVAASVEETGVRMDESSRKRKAQ